MHPGDTNDAPASQLYEISLRGVLGATLLSVFPTLTASAHDGVTVLSGCLPDQAALHGVLGQAESLGLELLAVRRLPDIRAPNLGGAADL